MYMGGQGTGVWVSGILGVGGSFHTSPENLGKVCTATQRGKVDPKTNPRIREILIFITLEPRVE